MFSDIEEIEDNEIDDLSIINYIFIFSYFILLSLIING